MAPEQGSPEGGQPVGDGGVTPPPTPPDGGPGSGAPDGGQSQGSDNPAAVIARLNAEAKDWRVKYEAAQAKLTEHEQAQLSELEKAQAVAAQADAKRTAAEMELQNLRLANAVRSAAAKANAVDVELVQRVIDLSRVEFAADGSPSNLDVLLSEAKSSYPVLFQQGVVRGAGDGGPRPPVPVGDMNELIRRGAGH